MPFSSRSKTRTPLDPTALLDYAVKSLGSKMKSERDLRRRLQDRAEPGEPGAEAVASVMQKLKDLGYLSDQRFAADYTRLRQENEKLGRRRVAQGLMQKGIPQPLAQQALSAAYDDLDEVTLVRDYIARKRLAPPAAPDPEKRQKETARLLRRLVAAGFSTQSIWKVLRTWTPDLAEPDLAQPDLAEPDLAAPDLAEIDSEAACPNAHSAEDV